MRSMTLLFLSFFAIGTVQAAFDLPTLPNIFGGSPKGTASFGGNSLAQNKKELLKAVSFTNNGKSATPEQQVHVLELVREIEKAAPPSPNLLSDPAEARALDGVWYLQYTSPSVVGDTNEFPNTWQPNSVSEGDSNIETRKFNAKGSVSAAGITVDTSNRVVKQILDVENSEVRNEIELDFGQVTVGGTFRQSSNVPNRAIVAFRQADITLKNGFKIKLGFVFGVLEKLRGTPDNGWLETTFLSADDMRIGRGNKGTMFVLTRDANAVKP